MTTTIVSTDINSTALPFTLENPGDVLILTDEGSITSESTVNSAVYSDAEGVSAIINGSVLGDAAGISFEGGNSSLEIGATGTVTSVNASYTPSPFTDVVGAVLLTNANNYLVNRGSIQAINGVGVWSNGPFGGPDSNVLVNYGTISSQKAAAVYITFVDTGLTNYGTIAGRIGVDAHGQYGALTLVNTGTITGYEYSISGSNFRDSLTNSGTLTGDVLLGEGDDTFDGRGGTINGTVYGGGGFDTYYVDDATMVIVEIESDYGNAVFSEVNYELPDYIRDMYLIGSVVSGVGNQMSNEIYGNGLGNVIYGLGGGDEIDAKSGNDEVWGGDGGDTIFGGEGHDTIWGENTGDEILGDVGDDTIYGGSGNDQLLGNDGDDLLRGGVDRDLFYGGEGDDTIICGDGSDVAEGGNGDDTLNGGIGDDVLYGGNGSDVLTGADGKDRLVGGAGYDQFTGGLGNDVFVFTSLRDSAGNNPDSIQDFKHGQDKIDLSVIDANVAGGTNDAFSFIGTGSFTKAGQVKIVTTGSTTNVYLNTDADAGSEMVFIVRNNTTLTASDFIL